MFPDFIKEYKPQCLPVIGRWLDNCQASSKISVWQGWGRHDDCLVHCGYKHEISSHVLLNVFQIWWENTFEFINKFLYNYPGYHHFIRSIWLIISLNRANYFAIFFATSEKGIPWYSLPVIYGSNKFAGVKMDNRCNNLTTDLTFISNIQPHNNFFT